MSIFNYYKVQKKIEKFIVKLQAPLKIYIYKYNFFKENYSPIIYINITFSSVSTA